MARRETSPAVRLRQLDKALERAKALPRDSRLTAQPMAKVIGVTWPTLRKWIDEVPGFGECEAVTRGAEGIEYEFGPLGTVEFLIGHFTAKAAESRERARRIAKAVTGAEPAEGAGDFDIDELNKIITARGRLRGEMIADGLLVEAARVERLNREYHLRLQQAIMRSAQEQDPTGAWPPEIRRSWEDATNAILLAAQRAGEDFFRGLSSR